MKSLAELKKMYKDLKTENIKLKQANEIMEQTIVTQEQRIEDMQRAVTDLKRRLARHDNFNTPPSTKKESRASRSGGNRDRPSKQRDGQNDAAGSAPRPRGRQKGHKGSTRKPKPTEFEEHTPDACTGCGSGILSITGTEERDITGGGAHGTGHHHAPHHKHVQVRRLRARGN